MQRRRSVYIHGGMYNMRKREALVLRKSLRELNLRKQWKVNSFPALKSLIIAPSLTGSMHTKLRATSS
jgi:hypothetical protein